MWHDQEEGYDSEWSDDYDHDDPYMQAADDEEESVDFQEFERFAKNKIKFHFACTLGPDEPQPDDLFFAEAELYMNASDYKSALIAALAADSVTHSQGSLRRLAVECICLYQMGARSLAVSIADRIESQVAKSSEISFYLKSRFLNTVEVLRFMPQLLGMLSEKGRNK